MAVPGPAGAGAVPELAFTVLGCEPLHHAAAPTLRFSLAVDAGGASVRSVMLEVQIRLAATQRGYSEAEQAQLGDLFGAPHRWGDTLRGLLWTHGTVVVPPFEGATVVDLLVPCTYDFEVAAAKYLAGVRDGDIPLDLLFSGAVFHTEDGRLQVGRIAWDRECDFMLPVALWREAMDRHFPGAGWIRIRRDTLDDLQRYKAVRALPTWDDALETLLKEAGGTGG